NSAGIDLSNEHRLAELTQALAESTAIEWRAAPAGGEGTGRAVLNPADHRDRVGTVVEVSSAAARAAAARAAAAHWGNVPVSERAARLERAADAMQARMPILLGLIVREAGKSLPNAISEVREA